MYVMQVFFSLVYSPPLLQTNACLRVSKCCKQCLQYATKMYIIQLFSLSFTFSKQLHDFMFLNYTSSVIKYATQVYAIQVLFSFLSHQWPRCSALKSGRREVPGSVLDRACRPCRSEFSMVFSETRVNTSQNPLEKPTWRSLFRQVGVPRAGNML